MTCGANEKSSYKKVDENLLVTAFLSRSGSLSDSSTNDGADSKEIDAYINNLIAKNLQY